MFQAATTKKVYNSGAYVKKTIKASPLIPQPPKKDKIIVIMSDVSLQTSAKTNNKIRLLVPIASPCNYIQYGVVFAFVNRKKVLEIPYKLFSEYKQHWTDINDTLYSIPLTPNSVTLIQ